jgi:hypothetical protein
VDGRAVEPGLEIELVTCQDDPSLVGQGDCSNTLWIPWSQGKVAYDYTELRLSLDVPPDAYALRYDFAFLTAEYPTSPARADAGNDMFVAWLESEVWTGNISTDASGHPVAVRSVLLDYQASEELQGFAFEGHGATKWLTTAASVTPGESIELIFAVFDMGDAEVDSAVLLDNFHWGCFAGPPGTTPVK